MSHHQHQDRAAAHHPKALTTTSDRPDAPVIAGCRCGGVAAAGVPVVHQAGSVADSFVTGIPAQSSPAARPGNTEVPVAGPVSYRGAPFEQDTTTGGTGRPVLVVFGGLVLALLAALAALAFLAPTGPATTTLAVVAAVVSVGAIVAVAAWMRTRR